MIIKSDKLFTEEKNGTGTTGIVLATDTAHFKAGTYVGFVYGTVYAKSGGSAKIEVKIGNIYNSITIGSTSPDSKIKPFSFVIDEKGDKTIELSLGSTYVKGTGVIPAYETCGYFFLRI